MPENIRASRHDYITSIYRRGIGKDQSSHQLRIVRDRSKNRLPDVMAYLWKHHIVSIFSSQPGERITSTDIESSRRNYVDPFEENMLYGRSVCFDAGLRRLRGASWNPASRLRGLGPGLYQLCEARRMARGAPSFRRETPRQASRQASIIAAGSGRCSSARWRQVKVPNRFQRLTWGMTKAVFNSFYR